MATVKTCIHCGQTKSLEQMRKDKRSSDGRGNVCKDCHNARRRQQRAEAKAAKAVNTEYQNTPIDEQPNEWLSDIETRLGTLEIELEMYRARYGIMNEQGDVYRAIDEGMADEDLFDMFIDELDRIRKQYSEVMYRDMEFLAYADRYGTEANRKWNAFRKFYSNLNVFYVNRLVVDADDQGEQL